VTLSVAALAAVRDCSPASFRTTWWCLRASSRGLTRRAAHARVRGKRLNAVANRRLAPFIEGGAVKSQVVANIALART
jgi:hypothetical protein